MWKTREGLEPPPNFWADFVATVNRVFPGATLSKDTLDELYRLVVDEWRNGIQIHLIVRQLCSCDGASVVPSPAAQQRLAKRRGVARPPEDAVRGQVFGLDDLRDPAPLARLIARAAMLSARIRSEQRKKQTAKRDEILHGLNAELIEITETLRAARETAYWSRPVQQIELPPVEVIDEPPKSPPKRRGRPPRKTPKEGPKGKAADAAARKDPEPQALDDDISDDLVNELARRA